MTVASVRTADKQGHPVLVQALVRDGVPSFEIVGVGEQVAREHRDRIRAAFINKGIPWPLKRIVVNVLPVRVASDAGLDLPIAYAVAAAARITGQVPVVPRGRLGLDGTVWSADLVGAVL